MEIICEIVRDLEELSTLRTLSPDTRRALSEHYAKCRECAARAKSAASPSYSKAKAGKIYQFPKKSPRIKAEFCAPEDVLIEKSMKRLSRRLKIQKTIRTICMAVAAVNLCAAIIGTIRGINNMDE